MRFSPPPIRRTNVTLLPMINVVFLLLIFFLLAGEMRPAEPFPIEPPEVRAEAEAEGEFTLWLGADGTLVFRDIQVPEGADDSALMAALAEAQAGYCAANDCAAQPPNLLLRADRSLPASRLAGLMPHLGALGFGRVDLIAASVGGAP